MGRARLVASLAGVTALVALLAPASALAGTYSWGLPGDFGGNNPDQKYGQASWSYEQGKPGNLTPLSCTAAGCTGGGDSVSVSGGKVVLEAAAGSAVTIVWTNPFKSSQSVTITSSFTASGVLCAPPTPSSMGTTTLSPGATVTWTLVGGLLLNSCSASGTISISATTPAVTLTSPSSGASITNGEPTYAGVASTAFDASSTVHVNVYSGSSASGTPAQTLSTTAGAGGAYSVTGTPLANGQYTAVAEQDDPVGSANTSAPVTFTIANPAGVVTLNSPGSVLTVAAPTLTGTAGTRQVDSNQVTVKIYSGTSATGTPVRQLTATVGSGGGFSVQVLPKLADGQYTAVASQASLGGAGTSGPVQFRVKVNPPAVSLTQPAEGVTINDTSPRFSGKAGDALGDSSTVTLYLYRGSHASGSPLGSVPVTASGSSWSTGWPQPLAYGRYTAVAVQTDDAGHTSRTGPVTFTLAPTPKLIGQAATLTRSGKVTVSIGCLAGPGRKCTGTVLIVTRHPYRVTPGGPTGPLELLFAKLRISGGQTLVVHRTVALSVLRVLLHHHRVPVIVTVKLSGPTGGPVNKSAQRVLQLLR